MSSSFTGNTDSNTVVKNVLDYPVLVRYIRFIPTTYNSWKALRVEVYGFGKDCSFLPVGIRSDKIPDRNMTSSSAYNSTTSPSKARLYYKAGSSWCAATSDSFPYLQINLGSPYIICGIATQGDHMTDQWVQSYNMLTSNDGSTFTKYMEKSQVKSFTGDFDSNTAVKNLLYDGTVSQYIRVASTSHYGSTSCMRTELYGIKHDGGCTSMFVGLSYSSIIPDHRFTASSYYDDRYKPHFARLSTSSKAWGPRTTSGAWLQTDLGSVVFVCSVATQGAGADLRDEFVRRYKLRVSLDNVNWNYYRENNIDKTFTGNVNKDQVVTNSLHPVKAKFVRFYPVRFQAWPSMRMEVYGISSACSSPVGLEVPSIIQNSQMNSSFHLDNNHTASHGRLYGSSSWCSSTLSNTQYIQINLGQVVTVTGIATQGDHTMDKWVTTYTISYSMDGNLWNTYKAGSNRNEILLGNGDKENVRVQWLSHPVTARHVRVIPQTWNTAICMRIELYGCDYATRPVITSLTNQNLTAASNSYVDLVCSVQEPLIQYIKWYTGNNDITTQSTGVLRGANGVKQSTLRVNYTSDADIFSTYDCYRFEYSLLCYKPFICKAMYGNFNTDADGIKSAGVKVRYDYPSTQTRPTVTFLSSTAVGIVWQKLQLTEFQKPVTSYVLVYQNGTYFKAITVSSLSLVITGLEIFTSYNITIKAVSIVGDGKWSQPMNFRTHSDVPTGFPTSITAKAWTSQSIRVTWHAPTSGINGPFLGYKVICISGNERHENTSQQTSHTFSGLRKWTVYNVTVVIRNDKGDGPINSYALIQTLEDAPGQPLRFQVTVLNSTGVRLDWALPRETNGIIRGFKLRYEKSGNKLEKDLPGNTTLTYVLTGLEKCTLYSFKMLAYTVKDGPFTSVIQKTTAEDAPSVPTNFKATITPPSGPSVPQLTLTWGRPAVCGNNIRCYKVSYNHSEDPSIEVETVDKSQLKITIPVWGGVTYEFRVSGVTNKEGPDTPRKVVAIPIYAPSVSPSNSTISEINETTFNVSWVEIPRSKSNGPVIAYEVNQTLERRRPKARRSIFALVQVKLMNSSCCSLQLYDLLLCTEYHISIKGYTSAGAGPSSDLRSLVTSVPGPPVDLNIQRTKKREISLKWQKPELITEAIESYTMLFEGQKDYNKSFVHSGSLLVSSTNIEVPNLYPGTRYTFRVSATTACGKGDYSISSSSTTKVDAPPAPVVGFVGNITSEVNNITVWGSSDINGPIKAYQIIVVKVDTTCSFGEMKLKSYEEAEKEELNYYMAAEIVTNPDKKFPRVFILGDEKEYNGYQNVKMKKGKPYQVLQRALTQDEKKEYLAGPRTLIARGKISEKKESFSGKSRTDACTACIDFSFFAASLAFNVAFLVVIVLVVVHNRKLKKQLEEMKKVKEKRLDIAFTQDVYANTNTIDAEEGLPMGPLPAHAGSTYEQIHGTVDPSDVHTEVSGPQTIATNVGGGYYDSINEGGKSNPNERIYETIHPETQSSNPDKLQNTNESPVQPTYQPLMPQTKPVYESLHL
ncbi:uncharacterized protein LOC116291753 isoform X2 [Actinia tenebrosa]|uniref:Uncharacterized protein LOC116291753 isoform X2 n=1 Tax=Actinia tenebrosa TaxID=6105 RepID=A0A6P8HQ62_ACTTE|nr:uncharacterized protein LOC116291753 isoform X2 [Actinia tenebrosa]